MSPGRSPKAVQEAMREFLKIAFPCRQERTFQGLRRFRIPENRNEIAGGRLFVVEVFPKCANGHKKDAMLAKTMAKEARKVPERGPEDLPKAH